MICCELFHRQSSVIHAPPVPLSPSNLTKISQQRSWPLNSQLLVRFQRNSWPVSICSVIFMNRVLVRHLSAYNHSISDLQIGGGD